MQNVTFPFYAYVQFFMLAICVKGFYGVCLPASQLLVFLIKLESNLELSLSTKTQLRRFVYSSPFNWNVFYSRL